MPELGPKPVRAYTLTTDIQVDSLGGNSRLIISSGGESLLAVAADGSLVLPNAPPPPIAPEGATIAAPPARKLLPRRWHRVVLAISAERGTGAATAYIDGAVAVSSPRLELDKLAIWHLNRQSDAEAGGELTLHAPESCVLHVRTLEVLPTFLDAPTIAGREGLRRHFRDADAAHLARSAASKLSL